MSRQRWAGVEPFEAYFNVADELDGGLRLDELDAGWVDLAHSAVDEHLDLPWPPHLAAAEEHALRRRRNR